MRLKHSHFKRRNTEKKEIRKTNSKQTFRIFVLSTEKKFTPAVKPHHITVEINLILSPNSLTKLGLNVIK